MTRTRQVLRVAAGTDVEKLGWSIRCYHVEGKAVRLSVVGAGAAWQVMKALIYANSRLATQAIRLSLQPSFENMEDMAKPRDEITVMHFDVYEVDPVLTPSFVSG